MRVALTTGLLVLLVACTGDPTPEAEPTPSAPPPTSAAPTVEPPVVDPPAPEPPDPITLAFAGDIHFEGPLRDRLLADSATALASATSTAALAAADLAIVNLETSVGEGGRPEPGKRFTFQAPASAFDALAAAGIDVATMANNHALDFGRGMLSTTFAAISAARQAEPPLSVVGVGPDIGEAFRPAVLAVGDVRVATIGATVASTDPTADPTGDWAATRTEAGTADAVDPRALRVAVTAAAAAADVVVVYMHWGIQGEACPSPGQRSLASRLVRWGADIVVGSHAHVVQGGEQQGAAYVAYGLGNYAWYQPSESGVLTLTVQPGASPGEPSIVTDTLWEPAGIGADGLPESDGRPGPFAGPRC